MSQGQNAATINQVIQLGLLLVNSSTLKAVEAWAKAQGVSDAEWQAAIADNLHSEDELRRDVEEIGGVWPEGHAV